METIQNGFRSFIRVLVFLSYLPLYLTGGYLIHLVTKDPDTRKRRFATHGKFWCKLACHTFGIRITVKGNPDPKQLGLVVGNHMGFLDVLVVASIRENLFITSQEMRKTPVLGLITEMAGCIYVDRRDRTKILGELHHIADVLKRGFRVVLYPEATSSDGEAILPFKRTLLQAAAYADVPILPYVFNYRAFNGVPGFPLKYRDAVCWYGDISFHTSLWRSFGIRRIDVEVEFLPPVYTTKDQDRAVVADMVRDMIVAKFQPVQRGEPQQIKADA